MRLLPALLALLAGLPAAAQDGPPAPPAAEPERAWVTLGGGLSAPYDGALVGTGTAGRTLVYQVGFQTATDFNLIGSEDHVSAFHVGLGLSRRAGPRRLTATAGPAFVWGRHDTPEGTDRAYYTGGVVVNGQALLAAVPRLGFGVGAVGFVNLNPVQSAAGVGLTVVVGNLP